MVAQFQLGFHLVTVCNGYIIHLVAETDDQHVLCIGPGCCYAHPDCDLGLCFRVLPMSYHDFTVFTHPAHHMAEFAVSVSGLVQVHKVHIHCFPRYLFVKLGMEMKQWFFQFLQTVDPHFGWREGVHPGYNTDTFVIVVSGFKCSRYLFC